MWHIFDGFQETTYPKGDIEIGFYLMYSDSKEVLRNPFKKPLEFMWSRWGHTAYAVSYTHLDVYKRQGFGMAS